MTDNNQHIEPPESVQKHSGRRRLLVKGAATAVPVVLTMRSGAAFALNTAISCIERDNKIAGGNQPPVVIDTHDTWLRKFVYCAELTGNGESFKVFRFSDGNLNWQHQDNISGSHDNRYFYKTEVPGQMKEAIANSPIYRYSSISDSCQVLVRVDPTTNLYQSWEDYDIGNVLPVDGMLPYVTESCWCSVLPIADPRPY